MERSKLLAGTALLEVLWSSRRKDLLDLIAPFVNYCTACKVSPADDFSSNNMINIPEVTLDVRKKFGYEDIPYSIIEKIYNRDNEHYKKYNKKYYLIKPLDEEVNKLERNRKECENIIKDLGISLLTYLQEHCQRERIYTKEQAIDWLQRFFSYYAVSIGTDSLDMSELSARENEFYYWIGRYIYKEKDENSDQYQNLVKLMKGYYLQAAIYIQPDTNIKERKRYKNVNFYYDTPFLIDLLGWQSEEGHQVAQELHHMLQEEGAHTYYFIQMENELTAILRAYQHSINEKRLGVRTLQKFDENGYTISNIENVIRSFPDKLENSYNVKIAQRPVYYQKSDGTVDEKYVLNEAEAKQFVADNTKHYHEKNLENDIESAIDIHKLRGGNCSDRLEHCGHILVTTNIDFMNAFNSYYREQVSSTAYDLIIDDKKLASLVWVYTGKVSPKMAELDLLRNAYAAMQPTPEMLEKFCEEVDKLKELGSISTEEALAIRADKVLKRELPLKIEFDTNNINSESAKSIVEEAKSRIIADSDARLNMRHIKKQRKREQELLKKAHQKALEVAEQKKHAIVTTCWNIAKIGLFVVFLISAKGCLLSFGNGISNIFYLFFAIASLISLGDMLLSKKQNLRRLIEKFANRMERKTYDSEYQKYKEIIAQENQDESDR